MRMLKWVGVALAAGTYWIICSLLLWYLYDMRQFVQGGRYHQADAVLLVQKMSLIACALTVPIWVLSALRLKPRSGWQQTWNISWKTAVVLGLYTGAVFLRRELWTPSDGLNDSAMFFPLVGRINGAFFSEMNWLIFLLQVTPIVSAISGILFFLQIRLFSRPRTLPSLGVSISWV